MRDWVSGRIPYYTSPPVAAPAGTKASTSSTTLDTVTDADVDSATLLTAFAPAFDLAGLFGEADALAFGELGPVMGGKGVKMDGIEQENEDAEIGWAMEEEVAVASEEEEEDDGLNVDDLLEDDDDDDEMDEDEDIIPQVAAPARVTRGTAAAQRGVAPSTIVSVAPPASRKSVSFAKKPLGPTATPAHANKLFAANDIEAPSNLVKGLKKNAKKDKKNARRAEKSMELEIEQVISDSKKPAVTRPVVAGEAYSFEEFFPSGAGGRKVPMQMEMDDDL